MPSYQIVLDDCSLGINACAQVSLLKTCVPNQARSAFGKPAGRGKYECHHELLVLRNYRKVLRGMFSGQRTVGAYQASSRRFEGRNK